MIDKWEGNKKEINLLNISHPNLMDLMVEKSCQILCQNLCPLIHPHNKLLQIKFWLYYFINMNFIWLTNNKQLNK